MCASSNTVTGDRLITCKQVLRLIGRTRAPPQRAFSVDVPTQNKTVNQTTTSRSLSLLPSCPDRRDAVLSFQWTAMLDSQDSTLSSAMLSRLWLGTAVMQRLFQWNFGPNRARTIIHIGLTFKDKRRVALVSVLHGAPRDSLKNFKIEIATVIRKLVECCGRQTRWED